MNQDKISHTQLIALVWCGVLAPVAELLPTLTLPLAGRGAWVSPLAAIPLVLLGGWLLGRLAGQEGLAHRLRRELGAVGGGGILLLYMVWAQLLLALRLTLCAQRLLASGYRDGAMWFFVLVMGGLVLWMGLGKVAAFARGGQLFLGILLATAGGVLALALFQTKAQRVLPLWWDDGLPIVTGALPVAGVLGWGLFGAFLTGHNPSTKGRGWHWLFWGAGGCLVLAVAQLIIIGSFGAGLAARLSDPFFSLAKGVGVDGAFERVESVVCALWVLADLTMAALLLFALRAMSGAIAPKLPQDRVCWGAVIVAIILAIGVIPDGAAQRWNQELVPFGNLVLGLAVPTLLFLLGRLCGKWSGTGISCGGTDQ